MNIWIVVPEKAYLQVLNQAVYLLFIQQQTRNCDHGNAVIRNCFGQVEFWKNLRRQE